MYQKYNNYDLNPKKKILGYDSFAFSRYDNIRKEINSRIEGEESKKQVIVCDLYPGADKEEILAEIKKCGIVKVIDTETCMWERDKILNIFRDSITEDRVFGIMTHKSLTDCFNPERLEKAKEEVVSHQEGMLLVIGVGASLITKGDLLLYFDMTRWEIQLRYRKGMSNWLIANEKDAVLTKYKMGFFIEWRLADKHKRQLFETFDYVVDTTIKNHPVMITGKAFCEGLKQLSKQPFRMQPYFDPGVWGGQWMKDVFGLDPAMGNYAWSFDGVPEENSINLQYGSVVIQLPCMDLTLYQPREVLGDRVHGRFGAEFPIRFDLLDTMGGGNLSLQVHPLTDYIQENFGMHYTQDESYYILDAKAGAHAYLGIKDNVDTEEMKKDLERAQAGEIVFDADKYANKIPVGKHDHLLIPAGTVHCSCADTMVLEISATPYIFTFKLWDWGRVGLDGLPRPIHIEHGMKNIQWDRNLKWVEENLVNQEEVCMQREGFLDEKTGLHRRQSIETHRYTVTGEVSLEMNDSVQVLNLVEGSFAVIESMKEEFEPFTVHYAETFIIPAAVGSYKIKSAPNETISVICAWIR
ncbi:MAG TPA: mannose-6-phosphate isomerase [Lachnoclostridium phytofermentans]|uniref:Mannose-6-phosphate isomerase n=1 Tax=Lachnoclostridium phytofermentans TaxID=66219 RepID=A0A3D2X3S0_9FIRM|nr:class I mannose-6-phosphate isomerase [Lachnoclostridium sp.]HCL01752.1 mannose-6-phosphate isomerase [Lachnoclostridium phytofermentans]